MLKPMTWNIQSVRSADGGADLGRVRATLDRFSSCDVLCLQEVACGFQARDGSRLPNQFAALASGLPGYSASWTTPVDTLAPDGVRCRLGTVVFARHRVLQVHAPIVGLRKAARDAVPPSTFDFAFVSAELAGRVKRLQVDDAATGSDHRPLLLELDEGR